MLDISGVTNANLEGPIAWVVTISILALPYVILGSILLYVLRKRTAPKRNIITLITTSRLLHQLIFACPQMSAAQHLLATDVCCAFSVACFALSKNVFLKNKT